MTEPVQPLTWQKRTNHEEHMQFFSKINEIVGQLSGTVERSETALEQATVALVEASTAVTEANTASAAASTAASTVAGYNTRLTAAESGVAANAANIGQLDIETQDLYDRDANSVKLSADHVQIVQGGLDLRGTNRAPNTAVGTDDTQMANGHRVVQELNAYTPMVRTTGSQTIAGEKSFTSEIRTKFNALDIDVIPGASQYPSFIRFVDKDGDSLGNIGGIETTGQSYRSFGTRAKMTNGEIKSFSLQLRVDRSTNHFVVQVAWPDGSYTTLAEKTIS